MISKTIGFRGTLFSDTPIWISFSGFLGPLWTEKRVNFGVGITMSTAFLTQNNCATQPWPYTKVFVCRLWVWRQLQLWGLPLIPRKYWMFVRCWNAGSVLKWSKHHNVIIQWQWRNCSQEADSSTRKCLPPQLIHRHRCNSCVVLP